VPVGGCKFRAQKPISSHPAAFHIAADLMRLVEYLAHRGSAYRGRHGLPPVHAPARGGPAAASSRRTDAVGMHREHDLCPTSVNRSRSPRARRRFLHPGGPISSASASVGHRDLRLQFEVQVMKPQHSLHADQARRRIWQPHFQLAA
jgi:hypothetical protein